MLLAVGGTAALGRPDAADDRVDRRRRRDRRTHRPTPSPASTDPPSPELAEFYSQELSWEVVPR